VDEGGITATKLYTTNQNVDDINVRCLKKIDKQSIFYDAADTGSEPFLSQLKKSMLRPYVLVATGQELTRVGAFASACVRVCVVTSLFTKLGGTLVNAHTRVPPSLVLTQLSFN